MGGLHIEAIPAAASAFTLRVDPSDWPPRVGEAVKALAAMHEDRRQNTDGTWLRALETQVRDWLRAQLERIPEHARLFVLQPAALRLIDLVSLLPAASAEFRMHWAVTPIFDDRDQDEQLAQALRRPRLSADHVAILRAAVNDARTLDEKLVDRALAAARAAGASVVVTYDGDDVHRFLANRTVGAAVRVLIAHSPRIGYLSVGSTRLRLPALLEYGDLCELDLTVCHSTPWAMSTAPRNMVITSCSGAVALYDVACAHAELWTGTLRRRLVRADYFESGFTYGEALVQARALVRHSMDRNIDIALALLAEQKDDLHDDIISLSRDPRAPCTPRRLARRIGRAFAAANRRQR